MSFSPAPVAASQSTESSARPGGHQHNKQGLLLDASPVNAGGSPPSQPHRPWLANAHVLCGQASLPGGRYGQVNQDWVITLVLHDSRQLRANGWPQCHLAVVLDGHGLLGEQAARQAGHGIMRSLRHSDLRHNQLSELTQQGVESLVQRAFDEGHAAALSVYDEAPPGYIFPVGSRHQQRYTLQQHGNGDKTYYSPATGPRILEFGTSATLVLVQGTALVVAHVGDSLAVLGREEGESYLADLVTVRHSGENEGERTRLARECGDTIFASPHDGYLTVASGRLAGFQLGMTRALGHRLLSQYGVAHTPSVTFRQLAPADVCLIAATDGVWDVLGYVPAVKLVADVIAEGGSAEEAATALCSEAVRAASGSKQIECGRVQEVLRLEHLGTEVLILAASTAAGLQTSTKVLFYWSCVWPIRTRSHDCATASAGVPARTGRKHERMPQLTSFLTLLSQPSIFKFRHTAIPSAFPVAPQTLAISACAMSLALQCSVHCSSPPQKQQRPPRWAHLGTRPARPLLPTSPAAAKTATAAPGKLELAPSAPAEHMTAEELVLKYNREMAEKMGWTKLDNPFEYHFDRPMYYHYIKPDMIVGSQPRNAADVDQLQAEGVTHILNLQQDKDLAYWGVSLQEISDRAVSHGMHLIRTPAVDFSPHSLRNTLPSAVRALEQARAAGGKVYVHCTAGLGRSPAVAIASLYWFTDLQLDEAYSYLTRIRPCGPSKDAIRGATYDLLSGRPHDQFQHEPPHAFATLGAHDRDAIRAKLLGN